MTLGEEQVNAAVGAGVPSRVVGRVETDLFCAGCHYNLHGLDVLCDARLDLAIVRWPECGKNQAPGIGTGAGRVPLLALAIICVLTVDDWRQYAPEYASWVALRLLFELLIQWAGVVAGITFGRRFARGILRAALSRKLLQYVRVLWEVDGIPPP